MAIIKYEDLNDVQRIIYGDGLTLEAVTIPMINNGLNARQLKGKPDKDGRYFDLDGNKIDSSRCWASTTSRQSILAEPYNAFSEKARSWSSMYGDEEPFLCYSRAYFDYSVDPEDPDAEKVYEWVTEGVGADIKYVALDIDKHSKDILHQVIVEASTEMDGSFETVLEIPKADLMRDEILEINEDYQGIEYVEVRFRFIKMPNHINEPILVNSAMLLREIEGAGLGGGCRPMSFKIGDKFVQEHPDGIGRLRPAFDGDKSWRYIMNKKGCEVLYEMLDGQLLPKKIPTPVIKPMKEPIVNADSGGPNAKVVVTADFDVPVGVKAVFSPELVVGSGHLVGKVNSSAEELVSGASIKAALPDDVVVPTNPTYTLEIDNTNGTAKKVGRITSTLGAMPNDVGRVYYLEGCVKFIVEVEGKFQEGEAPSKVTKKDASYNGKSFYDIATCDVVVNPALGTGVGGKFSRKDNIKVSYANVVMGESQISQPWELYVNNNPTGITAANAGEEVDLKAAILAMVGTIPDKETGYVVTFRVPDDNPKANGALAVSKSITVTFEKKPETKDPVVKLVSTAGGEVPNKIMIQRGATSLTGYHIELEPEDSAVTMADVTYSVTNVTEVNPDTTMPGYENNAGTNVVNSPGESFAVTTLCKPSNWKATKVATITLKATLPEGGEVTNSYDIEVPEACMFTGSTTWDDCGNTDTFLTGVSADTDKVFMLAHLTMKVGPVAKYVLTEDAMYREGGNYLLVTPVDSAVHLRAWDSMGNIFKTEDDNTATAHFDLLGVVYRLEYIDFSGGGSAGSSVEVY